MSYIVIEAANVWAQYSLCLYLSCVFGARDGGGQRIVASRARTLDEAYTLAVHAVKPTRRGTDGWNRNDLPDWQNKGHLSKTLRYVEATVVADVDRALGHQSRVLTDLPSMRNYFAHKAERSAASARNLGPRYGLGRALEPEVLLCSVPPNGGGDILLREWLADLEAIFGLMP